MGLTGGRSLCFLRGRAQLRARAGVCGRASTTAPTRQNCQNSADQAERCCLDATCVGQSQHLVALLFASERLQDSGFFEVGQSRLVLRRDFWNVVSESDGDLQAGVSRRCQHLFADFLEERLGVGVQIVPGEPSALHGGLCVLCTLLLLVEGLFEQFERPLFFDPLAFAVLEAEVAVLVLRHFETAGAAAAIFGCDFFLAGQHLVGFLGVFEGHLLQGVVQLSAA